MSADLVVRPFLPDDARDLVDVFRASVRGLARGYYTDDQIDAWCPRDDDPAPRAARIADNRPFVASLGGRIAGFADLQETGYIDQFFVAGWAARQGVGTALMRRIGDEAASRGIPGLFANVSLAAEAFFLRHGFVVEARQAVVVRGVTLQNARMVRPLATPGGPPP